MTFVKGVSGNPSGRKRGTTNQESRQLRSFVNDFVLGRAECLDEFYESLDPKLKANLIIKLLGFVLPVPVYVPEENDSPSEDFYETARRNAHELEI